MTIEGRIESLTRKHRNLHETVEVLEAEKAPHEIIEKVKKRKLAIKDELKTLINQQT